MKSLKTRILALIVCICTFAFTLSGCSLIVKDKTSSLSADAIKIGTTVLSKEKVVNLWYSFYSENSSYFYYYDEDTILDIFYKNIILKYAILQEFDSLKALGKVFYTDQDEAEVWEDVFEYISSKLDTYEKAIYTQRGVEDADLPARLQSEDDSSSSSVTAYKYTEYTFAEMDDYVYKTVDSNGDPKQNVTYEVGEDITKDRLNSMISLLKKYLFKYKADSYPEADEDDEYSYSGMTDFINRVSDSHYYTSMQDGSEEYSIRKTAYDMYISNLLLTSKANGSNKTQVQVLYEEIQRIYISYYQSYVYNAYSAYIKSLLNDEQSMYNALTDRAIVLRYLQLLGKDEQNYKIEENYVAVVAATADDTLMLYYYDEGEYYYFTVQHLLISFDDEITKALEEFPGNSSSALLEIYNQYKYYRDNYYKIAVEDWKNYTSGEQSSLNGWLGYNNASYRDDNGYTVYKLTEKANTSSVTDANGNTIYITTSEISNISAGILVYLDPDYELEDLEEDSDEWQAAISGYYYDTFNVDAQTECNDSYQRLIENEDGSYTLRTYLTNAQLEKCSTEIIGEILSAAGVNNQLLVYYDGDYNVVEPEEDAEYTDYISGYYFDVNATASTYADPTYQKLIEEDGSYTLRTYLLQSVFEKCTEDTILVKVVLDEFNTTYTTTLGILSTYSIENKTADEIQQELENNKNVSYVISTDLIKAYYANNGSDEIKNKIFANLFMQHAYKYSEDSASLGTDLSDYVGMIISSEGDNHTVGGGTYVAEFTDKARELVASYIENGYKNTEISADNFAISDYGIHIIVVNDVLEGGKVTGDEFTYNNIFGLEDSNAVNEAVQKAADTLKTTYVCTASSQSLYQYVYELIRDEMIGSSGTLLTMVRNTMYYDYISNLGDDNYLVYYIKMSYDELVAAIN